MGVPRFLEARARPPRLGIIRLGVMEGQGPSAHPREVEYFVLPSDLREKLGEERPTRLAVMFPFDEIHMNLEVKYEKRGASGKVQVQCDGPGGRYRMPQDSGADKAGDCLKPDNEPCSCGATAKGHLNAVLVDGDVGGVYWVMLGGEQRLSDLWSELRLFKQAFGKLTGIVFELVRVPTDVTVMTKKGRIMRKGWPVHCRVAIAARQAYAVKGIDLRELPGGSIIPVEQKALPAAEEDGEAAPEIVNGMAHDTEPSAASGQMPVGLSGNIAVTEERPADASWDVSLLYAIAAKCDVKPDLYDRYLVAVYGTTGADLSDSNVAKERARLEPLTIPGDRRKSEVNHLAHKAIIIRDLNEALKRRGGGK